jgi:hypothetical protein
MPREIVAALHRAVGHPLVLDGLPRPIEQPRRGAGVFRWEKRRVRALLQQLFPGWECHTDAGAIFLNDPNRLRRRLHQLPPAVETFLKRRKGPLSLDDLSLLARSLTPWQVVKLQPFLPQTALDQLLAAQDLLKLYGELLPAQREELTRGVSCTTLTPTQQVLFLQFAQRQWPFVEGWRLQEGILRLQVVPVAEKGKEDNVTTPAARAIFDVRLPDSDTTLFPVDLVAPLALRWDQPLTTLVGQPFSAAVAADRSFPNEEGFVWQPALAALPLQNRSLVVVISWPFAEPYVGTQAPPTAARWARGLAERLRDTGVTVVHVTVGAREQPAVSATHDVLPSLISVSEPGNDNGEPFNPAGWGAQVDQSPSVLVVGRNGILSAVFEGEAAWDTSRVEQAARSIAATSASPPVRARAPQGDG